MAMYLKITDGTTTIDLLGNDATNNFNLLAASWAPNVAKRKQGKLSGQWAEDVVESIPLYVQSDTDAATILANLNTLAALLDQAQRWNDGENVAAVTIRYSPNSDTNYLETVILGPSGNGVELPPTFSDDLYQNAVDGVRLNFKRRGAWYGARVQTSSPTDTSSGNPDLISLTWGTDVALPSPVEFDVDFLASSAFTTQQKSVFFISNDTSRIVVREGESADVESVSNAAFDIYPGDYYSTVSVTGASGGSVAQTTSGGTSLGFVLDTPFPAGHVAVWALIKKVGGSGACPLSVSYSNFAEISGPSFAVARIIEGSHGQTVPAIAGNPDLYFCGSVSSPDGIEYLQLNLNATAAATVQIDYLIFQMIDSSSDHTFVITNEPFSGTTTATVKLNHDPVVDRKPFLLGFRDSQPSWSGNLSVNLSGDTIALLVAGVNKSGSWVIYSGNEANVRLKNCYRRPAYLVPR